MKYCVLNLNKPLKHCHVIASNLENTLFLINCWIISQFYPYLRNEGSRRQLISLNAKTNGMIYRFHNLDKRINAKVNTFYFNSVKNWGWSISISLWHSCIIRAFDVRKKWVLTLSQRKMNECFKFCENVYFKIVVYTNLFINRKRFDIKLNKKLNCFYWAPLCIDSFY